MIEGFHEPGLNQRLLLRTQLGRSDYSWADLLTSNPDWVLTRADVLFWNVYRPGIEVDGRGALDEDEQLKAIDRLQAPASLELEGEFAKTIGALARRFGDSGGYPEANENSDEREQVVALSTSAWLSAAHALALKRSRGRYDEDVQTALQKARKAGMGLGLERVRGSTVGITQGFFARDRSIGRGFYGLEEFYELKALHAIVLLELFQATANQEPADDRLHLLAVALDCLDDALAYALEESSPERLAQGGQTDLETELLGLYWYFSKQPPPNFTEESDLDELRFALRDLQFSGRHDYGLCEGACPDPQEAARLIGELLADGHRVKWLLVTDDCSRLTRRRGGIWDTSTEICDEGGQPWPIGTYAAYARGRAEERLSPGELSEVLRLREERQSEERLKGYFFPGALWFALPERAQRALGDADQAMLSPGRGRPERFLEDLKVATESVCWELIWQPLRETAGDNQFADFKRRDSELGGLSPSLVDYADVCTMPPVQAILVSSWQTTQIEIRAIVDQLRQLNRARNPAQHEPGFRGNLEEARKIYNAFLGIGGQGVLPTLAKARLHVSERAPRQLPPQPELRLLPDHDQP